MDLKKQQASLIKERSQQMKSKCDMVKKIRLQQYKDKTQELDKKERELRKKTNQLVDELVDACDDTPFHKALLKILGNLKGTVFFLYIFLLRKM